MHLFEKRGMHAQMEFIPVFSTGQFSRKYKKLINNMGVFAMVDRVIRKKCNGSMMWKDRCMDQ